MSDELAGRTLICPQCNGRFLAPASDSVPAGEEFGAISDETSSPGGSEMAFLDNLSALPGPSPAKSVAKTLAATRSSAARGPASASSSFASPRRQPVRRRRTIR